MFFYTSGLFSALAITGVTTLAATACFGATTGAWTVAVFSATFGVGFTACFLASYLACLTIDEIGVEMADVTFLLETAGMAVGAGLGAGVATGSTFVGTFFAKTGPLLIGAGGGWA